MPAKPTTADEYLANGCGRCKDYATPQCKVLKWQTELPQLRQIILQYPLAETIKWGIPVYTYNEKNVLTINAFKTYCSIGFFNGHLLADPEQLLQAPGENSQTMRMLKFDGLRQVAEFEAAIKQWIEAAIANEKSGIKPTKPVQQLVYPNELLAEFAQFPDLRSAFEKLTPGRQRAYLIYFTQPKQSATVVNRIKAKSADILAGKGIND